MKPDQTRLDTAVAAVAVLTGCDDMLAGRKPDIGVAIAGPSDADPAKAASGMRAYQGLRGNAQHAPSDALRTGAAAGRISVATLAAAREIAQFHAVSRGARAASSMQAEPRADRVPVSLPAARSPA